MSTTPPSTPSSTAPTFTSSSTAGSTSDNGNSLQSSASLYLYTFLATLVLLLGVSAAIVIRSLLLRRRHRRMIEEAIRNGTWIPPSNNRLRIDPSKKPRLFEAYLSTSDEHQDWDTVMPFSVYAMSTNEKTAITPSQSMTNIPAPSRMWRRVFRPNNAMPPSLPTSVPTSPLAQTSTAPEPSALRVAVLIAMPSQTPLSGVIEKNHSQHLEEDDLPHLEFGVTDVPVTEHRHDDENETRKRSIGSSVD